MKTGLIRQFTLHGLLGEKFNIATHKNTTLIYNLGCLYATENNKAAMLDTIKQVRKLGIPAKRFMGDSDLKNYRGDADFLNALN